MALMIRMVVPNFELCIPLSSWFFRSSTIDYSRGFISPSIESSAGFVLRGLCGVIGLFLFSEKVKAEIGVIFWNLKLEIGKALPAVTKFFAMAVDFKTLEIILRVIIVNITKLVSWSFLEVQQTREITFLCLSLSPHTLHSPHAWNQSLVTGIKAWSQASQNFQSVLTLFGRL